MNKMDFLMGMNEIDDKFILEADSAKKADFANRKVIAFKRFGMAAAAAFAISIAVPNISPQAATTLGNLPVVGAYFKTVTIRNYSYEDDRHEATVDVKGIDTQTSDIGDDAKNNAKASADEVNAEMTKITDEAIEEFKTKYAEKEGVFKADVRSETVTDSDRYYCIKLTLYESVADSYTVGYYYTIDKKTGKRVDWDTLLGADKEAKVKAISENIIEQMRSEMQKDEEAVYWIDTDMPEYDFKTIKDDTEFYIDKNGSLVVYFPQGDYAPMSMGELFFTIPSEVSGIGNN